MIFKFIKYTNPSWQFNISPVVQKFPSCVDIDLAKNSGLIDENYQTDAARFADAGYQLWNKGILIESGNEEMKKLHDLPSPTLHDEYVFIRKYWGTLWASYALLSRLISFKNPVKEISAYVKTSKVKRINIFKTPHVYQNYESFQSSLVENNPFVAVIIPTLNRYEYLKDVLHDLEKQSYKNFEVVIVDQSTQFRQHFYNEFNLNIRLIYQLDKKLWTARNKAIKATQAQYLLFFDDDSRVESDWILHHLKCLDFFDADISAGVSLATIGMKVPDNYSYFRWADQFDSGNAMVRRDVFKKIGLFDEQFNGQSMGDGEFGYRAYKHGFKSISNRKAFRIHLKVSSGGLREMGSWDGFRPKKWFSPKPVPSVIYLYKKYLPADLYRHALLLGIMLSNVPYKQKRNAKMLFVSVVLTFIKSPVLFVRFLKARSVAENMLRNDKGIILLER